MRMLANFFPDREFRALLFDFDGTLADTMPAHFQAWNKALAVYGKALTLEQHQAWAGRPTREIVRLLNELHGIEMSAETIARGKEEAYLTSFANVKEIVAVADIVRANFAKRPMAIVSGSRRAPVETTLRKIGLTKYFDTLVCAEDYVQGKPAPDCFLTAAARLRVPAHDCLVFEDAELGIQGAHAAGMACVRVGPNLQLSVVRQA